MLDWLTDIYKELINDSKHEIKHHLQDFEEEWERYIETKRREKEFDHLYDEFKKIGEATAGFYCRKFENNIKRVENKISSTNILELIQIQRFIDDLFEKLTYTHKIKTSVLKQQFK